MKDRRSYTAKGKRRLEGIHISATMLEKLLYNIIPITVLFNFGNANSFDDDKATYIPKLTITYGRDGTDQKYNPKKGVQYLDDSRIEGTRRLPLFYAGKAIDWCKPLPSSVVAKIPRSGWIAMIPDDPAVNCTCKKKLQTAKDYNASAAIILFHNHRYNYNCDVSSMSLIAVTISDSSERKELVRICRDMYSDPRGQIFCKIIKSTKSPKNQFRVSRTSVLFVLVSFILLMCISLAWLVFYYVQRFRHIYRNDRKEKQLLSAAKKAISKLKTISFNSANIDGEDDSCAVCLDNYKDGENIRILPCKHLFHKSCIDPWLLNHRTCPMCKSNILKSLGVEIPDNIDLSQYDVESRRISHDAEVVQSSPTPAPPDDDEEEERGEMPEECAIPSTSVYSPGGSSSQAWPEPNVANASVCSSTSSMLSDTDSERSTVALVSVVQKV